MDGSLQITCWWVQPDQLTPTKIVGWVVLKCFLWGLRGEQRIAMEMKAAQTSRDMVAALECLQATLEIGRGEQRTSIKHESHYLGSQGLGTPMELEHSVTARPIKPCLVGCIFHTVLQLQVPTVGLWLISVPVSALLDSGSTIILTCPSALTRTSQPCKSLAVTCVHGHVRVPPPHSGPDRGLKK